MKKKEWREKRRAEGWKDILVWLDPKSVEVIEGQKKEGESYTDVVNRLIQENIVDNIPSRDININSNMDFYNRIISLEQRLEKIENRDTKAGSIGNINKNINDIESYIEQVKERMRALKNQGYSLFNIADILNKEGYITPQYKSKWSKDSVKRFFHKHLK